MSKRRNRLTGVLLAGVLLAAACGGDDDDSGSAADDDSSDSTTDDADDGGDDESTDTTMADDSGDDGGDADGGDADDGGDDESTDTTMADDSGDDGGDADEGGDEGGDMVEGEVCTADRAGGEITIAPRGTGTTLDPYNSQAGTIQTAYETVPVYSSLMRFDNATTEYVPYVAESLEPSEDGMTWTLKLREDVVFGNGDPLDADAMIAHVERHLGEGSTSLVIRSAAPFISGWNKVDDWTVDFELYAPYGQFPGLFITGLGMVQNVALIDEMGQEAFSADPTGGGVGPYEIEEWAPPERTVLVAKDDWWGGPVCIEKITINFIPDLGAAYDAYGQGEVDVIYMNRDPVLLDEARTDNPDAHFGDGVWNGAFLLLPNIAVGGYEGPLSDVRVRQAMNYAIDPEIVNQRAWGGVGWPGKGVVNDVSTVLSPTEGVPYDPDMATQLLDEYKAETGWDGTIASIAAGSPQSNLEAALAVAAQLEAVGFNVEESFDLEVVPLITQVYVDQSYESVASWGFINAESDLYAGLRGWLSPELGGFQNGYASPAYDAAASALRSATTIEEQQAALEELQTVINEEVPFVIYGADAASTLARPEIKGIRWQRGIDPLFEFAYLEN